MEMPGVEMKTFRLQGTAGGRGFALSVRLILQGGGEGAVVPLLVPWKEKRLTPFVTQGFEAAYAQARETAREDGIDIAGGASTVRQALAAGVIDELTLDVAPILLGSGERLFDGVEFLKFEPVEVLHSPLATHIRYRRAG